MTTYRLTLNYNANGNRFIYDGYQNHRWMWTLEGPDSFHAFGHASCRRLAILKAKLCLRKRKAQQRRARAARTETLELS